MARLAETGAGIPGARVRRGSGLAAPVLVEPRGKRRVPVQHGPDVFERDQRHSQAFAIGRSGDVGLPGEMLCSQRVHKCAADLICFEVLKEVDQEQHVPNLGSPHNLAMHGLNRAPM
eukprot:313204-Hanusia_phi.AAC.2